MSAKQSKSTSSSSEKRTALAPLRTGGDPRDPREVIQYPFAAVTYADAVAAERDLQVALARNVAPLATFNR